MKKFVAGVLVGAVVATAGSALAAQNETISATFTEFNILVNGKQASLGDKPVVIEGSSYLPVRAISNTLGYQVQYDGESRTISLANDGNKYLKTDDSNTQPVGKTEDNKQVSNGNFVKDLKGKYSKDGKLDAELIKKAIGSKEVSVNAQDEVSGDSLLILAIKENNFAVYQVLKDNKVDPELANSKDGRTPLHIAVIEKNSFFMGELLSVFKVKTKLTDKDGKVPQDYTQKGTDEYTALRGFDK
ncbi:stalk domain-containing protein [Paenibacillus oleatilyticus]|uniref:stalk domain-containing protein n=1 Tax=Paenibacillus oleatilyticus TaxID=2594886 RepID=UPI001C1F4CF7|nr:stalk domain-containing protein [Paenibacillus oleatilyticus]MBU7316156.1 ankyrin repeat domain-containing protein [Paenibacillus oleatilyticus]